VCVAVALGGCGGGSPTAASRAEAHLAALANAICRESKDLRATSALFEAHRNAQLARLGALVQSDRELPRVRTLSSDVAARHRVVTAMTKVSRKEGHVANVFSLMGEDYRLAVKVAADEKALGLTSCIVRPQKPIEG
jgi:hypothetical protein